LRQSLSTTAVATVPSVAARAGNLSTGKVTISPVIQPYLALWHLPNGALLGAGDTGQYLFSARSPSSENAGTIKLDDLISGKDSLAAFYSVDDGSTSLPDALNTIFIDSTLRRNTASISELHIFNPQLLNAFRMGMNRVTAHALNSSPGNNPAASDASLGVLPGRDAPVLVVPGLTTFGGGVGGPAFSNFWVTNFQFYDDLSIQKGRHAIKVGGDFVRYRFNIQLSNTPNGQYSFNSLSDFLTNQKLTTFLADVFFSGSQVSPVGTAFPERGFRQSIFGGYAQDNIRVLPNLTINLGFRYEAATVPGEVNNLTGNLRDIYSINLNPGKQLFQNPTHFDFAPRVGLAWDPFKDGQTSIRAAYGIYDVLPLAFELAALEGNSGPFANAVSIANPPAGSFPQGGYNQILALGPSSVPVREPSIEYNPRRNYVMQWNTSVQRTLVPDLTLLVAYAGSHGVHMTGLYNDANIVTPTLTPQGYLWPTPIGSGTKLNPTLGAIRQLTWGGSAVYDSLQTRIQRRFRHGLQLTGSFTWQKALDDVSSTSFTNQFQNSVNPLIIDRHLIRGPSDFNVARVAVISGIWELPRSKSSPAAVQAVVNGWQMGGIFTVSDGLPFTALISGDPAGEKNSFAYDTPNRVVGPACTHLTNPGNPNGYINLSCFSFPVPANLFGNAGRNSLVGPGLAELDFSIMRNFRVPLSESGRLQFRAEAFNLANRANFQGPVSNNSLYNASGAPLATAGVITSTATTSRQIQFALRLLW
jgi:TonB dependent receptor